MRLRLPIKVVATLSAYDDLRIIARPATSWRQKRRQCWRITDITKHQFSSACYKTPLRTMRVAVGNCVHAMISQRGPFSCERHMLNPSVSTCNSASAIRRLERGHPNQAHNYNHLICLLSTLAFQSLTSAKWFLCLVYNVWIWNLRLSIGRCRS
jgi:hypothetical protein